MIDIKPKDAIKLNIFKLDKSKAYPEENVLPEDYFFFLSRFSFTDTDGGQQLEGGDHLLFHSTLSTRSRTFRHLFATLHVR